MARRPRRLKGRPAARRDRLVALGAATIGMALASAVIDLGMPARLFALVVAAQLPWMLMTACWIFWARSERRQTASWRHAYEDHLFSEDCERASAGPAGESP